MRPGSCLEYLFTSSNTFAVFEKMEEKREFAGIATKFKYFFNALRSTWLKFSSIPIPGIEEDPLAFLYQLYDNLDSKNLSTKYACSSHFYNNFRFIHEKRKQKCHLMELAILNIWIVFLNWHIKWKFQEVF